MVKDKPIPPCDKNYKLYFKSGGNTTLIAKNMTYSGAKYLGNYIKNYLKKHGTQLEGNFLKPLH